MSQECNGDCSEKLVQMNLFLFWVALGWLFSGGFGLSPKCPDPVNNDDNDDAIWAMFRKPQPLQLVQKVRQYTSNLYGSTPPICIAAIDAMMTTAEV